LTAVVEAVVEAVVDPAFDRAVDALEEDDDAKMVAVEDADTEAGAACRYAKSNSSSLQGSGKMMSVL
jgi:hypothetical protein